MSEKVDEVGCYSCKSCRCVDIWRVLLSFIRCFVKWWNEAIVIDDLFIKYCWLTFRFMWFIESVIDFVLETKHSPNVMYVFSLNFFAHESIGFFIDTQIYIYITPFRGEKTHSSMFITFPIFSSEWTRFSIKTHVKNVVVHWEIDD